MMSSPADQAAALMRFTPAEKQVVKEQCEALRMFTIALSEAVQDGNGVKTGDLWQHMAEHMQYLGTMLSMKNAAAVREYMTQQEG